MDYPGRNSKRVRLNSSGDAHHTTWQHCHSGFEDDMIESEHLKTSATCRSRTKGRKGTKLPTRKSTEKSLDIPNTEIEIDWESSSSEDEDPDPQRGISATPERLARQNVPKSKTFEWLSPIMKPDQLRAPRVKTVGTDEDTVSIDDAEKITEKVNVVDETETAETRISDYDSSDECVTPSSRVSNQGLPSSAITPTQSPSISSYGQSTQESATSGVSPLTSSQWVSMFKRGQQTTPTKTSMPGNSHTEETEGKDSAKKKMKFTSRGLAERLQKLINREKSDVAFWQHQPLSQQESQTGVCRIKINSFVASRGLFVAHCSNLEHVPDVSQSSQGRLPEKVVVLFSHKTVEDKHLQVGSSVAIHPPWQKLSLPGTSQTVLLCTYFCQVIDSGSGDRASSSSTDSIKSSQQVPFTPRQFFRPNRLFSENPVHPKLCLSESVSAQSQFWYGQIAESLLEILSVKGPSFDFEFNLRALVLRVCEMVSTRTPQSVEEQSWRVLARDKDGTIFEVHLTCDENQVLESLQGKFVDFKQLKVSQRVNKMRCPGLFSMIDSFSKSFANNKAAEEPGKPEVAVPMQRISFLLMGSKFDLATKDTDEDTLTKYSCHPTKIVNLSEIQKQEAVQRVSFHVMLLHSTPAESLNPGAVAEPKRRGRGSLLLFVTDPSLLSITKPESTNSRDHSNYIGIRKLSSCAIKWTEADFEKACRSVIYFEDVFMEGDTSLVLDCYSSVSMNINQESRMAGKSVQLDETLLKSFENCLSISYPELTDDSLEDTLVSISGIMEGVDEDTAYSWPVCNDCESNRLGNENSGSKLYCPVCAKEVLTPETRIHLELLVRCSRLKPKCRAKVKLKQQTIKHLFGEPSSSEPFDLKRIMGKSLPPTSCFVRKVSALDLDQKVIQLEEI